MKRLFYVMTVLLCVLLTACGNPEAQTVSNSVSDSVSEYESELVSAPESEPVNEPESEPVSVPDSEPVNEHENVPESEPVNEGTLAGDENTEPAIGAIYEASIYSFDKAGYGVTLEVNVTGNPHTVGSLMRITVADSLCDFKLLEEITTSRGDLVNAETMPRMVDATNDATGVFGYRGDYVTFSVESEDSVCEDYSMTFGVHRQSQINGDVAGYIDIRGGEMVYYTIYWANDGTVYLKSDETDWSFRLKELKYED